MAMKTPGVYTVERNAFPNSVVEVATSVPAFIGYTEKAVIGGRSLISVPTRITSMTEYLSCFGGPAEAVFTVVDVTNAAAAAAATAAAPPARGQASTFGWKEKKFKVERAALKAGGRFNMYPAMQHFFANGGAACYIVAVGDYSADVAQGPLMAALELLAMEQEPTMVLVPDAVLLDQTGCMQVQQAVLAHCGGRMKNRVAILDVWGGDRPNVDPSGDTFQCIAEFRNDIGIDFLDFGAAYYPWLKTSLVGPGDINQHVLGAPSELTKLASLLKTDLELTAANKDDNPRSAALWEALEDLGKDNGQWLDKVKAAIDADRNLGNEDKNKAKAKVDALKAADASKQEALLGTHMQQLHKTLTVMSGLYAQVLSEVRDMLNLLPPSPAMAGLYTMVDNSRGVWKAPANVSVAGIVGPAVEISHEQQEDLNVTTSGKSINAIRSFVGEGALVWGARTLDGNSLDWRYINVRRTMIMLEESCRLAAKAMVFEPNVANTWVTIKSMITNFLTGIWKRGGLAGAVPDDAFSVHVGLGDTMTQEDLLDGILRVTVLVAVTRPAEFIEITFQQKMQKS